MKESPSIDSLHGIPAKSRPKTLIYYNVLAKIKSLLARWSVQGLKLPSVRDPLGGKPSVTLLFAYTTFAISCGSVVALHFKVTDLPATLVSIMFWVLAVVFYRMRKLDDIKLNLKSGEVDLKDTEEPKQPAKDE